MNIKYHDVFTVAHDIYNPVAHVHPVAQVAHVAHVHHVAQVFPVSHFNHCGHVAPSEHIIVDHKNVSTHASYCKL